MRIAVCISGGLRTFEIAAPLLQEKFIVPLKAKGHEVDIFFYGLSNNDGKELNEKKLVELYQPKKYVLKDWNASAESEVLSGFSQEQFNFMNIRAIRKDLVVANLSQMYNIKKVFELMSEHEEQNGFRYDLAIRTRPDVYYFRTLDEDQIDTAICENTVSITDEWDFKCVRPFAISDIYAMGNSAAMKKYSKIYDSVYSCTKDINLFHVESLTGHYIQNVAHLNRTAVNKNNHWFWFEYPPGAPTTTINRYQYGV